MNIWSFIDQIAPRACLLCGGDCGSRRVCASCFHDLPWHTRPQCPRCALPTPDGQVCGACLKRPPAFDRTLAAFVYAFPLDQLIPRLKYHGRLAVAPALGAALAETVALGHLPDSLTAMPLHARRVRERGFNHATEIAREVSRQLGIPLDTASCRRTRDTPPQMALTHDARRRNVRGAFACSGDVRGRHIAIVDDVMTTGTSLDELAATLKRAGAATVTCWVAARTLAPADQPQS